MNTNDHGDGEGGGPSDEGLGMRKEQNIFIVSTVDNTGTSTGYQFRRHTQCLQVTDIADAVLGMLPMLESAKHKVLVQDTGTQLADLLTLKGTGCTVRLVKC